VIVRYFTGRVVTTAPSCNPSLLAGHLLAPSLVGRRSILAGLLLILSSFRTLDCMLLLHRLVCHPRLRGRLRGVGFGGLVKASSDLCRGLLLPGETDDGGVLVVPSLVASSCLTSSLLLRRPLDVNRPVTCVCSWCACCQQASPPLPLVSGLLWWCCRVLLHVSCCVALVLALRFSAKVASLYLTSPLNKKCALHVLKNATRF
jgi:hypothetical protein